MGLTEAAIATPIRRVPEKALRSAGLARGFEALRVPWFDEDALTLAIDAGLALGEAVDRAERVVLALDEPHEQAVLALHALGLDAELTQVTGPLAGLEALTGSLEVPTLVLTGGTDLGGAGAAVLDVPGEGIELEATAHASGAPLDQDAAGLIGSVLDTLPEANATRLPAGTPGRRGVGQTLADPVTARIGRVGAAGGLVELLDALAAEGSVRVAAGEGSRAIGVATGAGGLSVHRVPSATVDVSVDAWQGLSDVDTVPWSEASQGAYVSREDYDADPSRRYGARALGEVTVATVTTIQAGPPAEFLRQHAASGAYDVAIVEHGDGERSIHQVAVPPGELAIGDRARGVLRRLFSMEGQWRYAVKLVPA